MEQLTQIWRRLRYYFRRSEFDRELEEEMRFHLEMKLAEQLSAGLDAEAARSAAERQFGNQTRLREVSREMWSFRMIDTLVQDLRYGLRMLRRNPGFTAAAVLTLALGTGVNTAIFSLVNAVLLTPLPYPEPGRLVQVEETHNQVNTQRFTHATFLDLEDGSQSLQEVAACRPWPFNLIDEEPEQVQGALVSANFFPALGVAPRVGRFFSEEENRAGNGNAVIISSGLWQRRFGADPGVIGKTIRMGASSGAIVGVMPPSFQFPDKAELWAPLGDGGVLKGNRRAHLLIVIARLKPGATIEQARAEMSLFANRVERQNPGVDPGLGVEVSSLQQKMVAPVRPALLMLFGAVGFVLLIACANVANLQLARAAAREKEMAVRAALGAGRLRLCRQLLTESVLLSVLGGLAGLWLAAESLKLVARFSPADLVRLNDVGMSGRVFVFALVVSLLTGLLVGLAPALRVSGFNLNDALKESGRSPAGSGGRRLRHLLVISEVALALVLLIGAGLLVNGFARLLRVDPGFNPNNLLTMHLFLSPAKYTDARKVQFIKEVLDGLASVPGAASASIANTLPITGGVATDFEIEGRSAPSLNNQPVANIQVIDALYFRTMGIPLLEGRAFDEHDGPESPKAMVISDAMARQYWPDEDPIGKRVTMKDWGPPLTGEIVGVAGDVRAGGLDSAVRPMIYWPYTQFPQSFNYLVVRTTGDPFGAVAAVKGRIWSVDREQPIASIRTMEQVLSDSVAQRRFNMLLLGFFALVALVLAAVGIYGVISYTVARRTHEIGIRMALGAQRRHVLGLVVGQGMALVLMGVALGLIAALLLTRAMSSLLYGVSATDPLTFAGLALLLAAVAFLACYLPARRAARVDPLTALRHE